MAIHDWGTLEAKTKKEIVEIVKQKDSLIEALQNRIIELEQKRERTAKWRKDIHGVLRCTGCRKAAPKQVSTFYDGRARVHTPYCMWCGAKMEEENK